MLRTRAILVAALAIGCAGDGTGIVRGPGVGADRVVALDSEFTMTVHETTVVEGTEVLIFFDGVSEDSRCPAGVQCPWEGNAAVRLELSSRIAEFAPQLRVLNTAVEPRETEFMGVTIRLVGVSPYPRADDPPIDPAGYAITLIISRP